MTAPFIGAVSAPQSLTVQVLALLQPFRHRDDVGLLDRAVVLVAQQVFEQHFHRIGKFGNSLQTVLLGGGQAVIDVGLATDLEGLAAFEAVERGHVRKSQFSVIPGRGINRGI